MDWINMLGYLAAVATTVSFLPQAIHTIKTKDTKGISLGMYTLFVLGVLMWLLYGLFTKNLPIILANVVTVILAAIILIYKLKYK